MGDMEDTMEDTMGDIIQTKSRLVKLTEKEESGEIDHREIFSNQIYNLCMSEKFSDVTFEIQEENIPGHFAILATRSKYFRDLFDGLAETEPKLFELEVPIKAFKALLKYMYSGRLSLSQMCEEDILDTLSFAIECGCPELELRILKYLGGSLSLDNVWTVLNTAHIHGYKKLQKSCYKFFDANPKEVLGHESFKNLLEEALRDIIIRDTFSVPEFQIFTAVSEWCKHNSNVSFESVISLVRLPLLSFEKLLKVVRYSGISECTLLDAIDVKTTSTSLPYRGELWQRENVALERLGARITQGGGDSPFKDGNSQYYGYNNCSTRHIITKDMNLGIIVELGSITILNHIKLLLLERDSQFYSYFIDVSDNNIEWDRVVDTQSHHCSSWQFLYFPSRPVRYIKLVGTYGSVESMFEIVSLEAYYTAKVPKMIDGVIAPSENVATREMGAMVIEGNDSENLLNGVIDNYDTESGYTWSYIENNSIVVRLGQPYLIGSMRLLLWGRADTVYSYYIETSTNNQDWTLVVDRNSEECSSWQNLIIEPRTMTYIKIVGTKSSDNESFRCVHFECTSQKPNIADDE